MSHENVLKQMPIKSILRAALTVDSLKYGLGNNKYCQIKIVYT